MKNIIFLIYFILFIQYVYNRTISIESNEIPDELIDRFNTTTSFIKNENSKIKVSPDSAVFCKDNVCTIQSDLHQIKPFIELPDKNGYIHKYILIPYANGYNVHISSFIRSNSNETIHISTDCKTDTQCYSNKCFNNTCTYNVEANVERCNLLYTHPTLFSTVKEYMKCGRMIGESCTKNSDCSSNICDGNCYYNSYKPSESDSFMLGLPNFCLKVGFSILLIIILFCSGYCFRKWYEKKK